MSYLLILEQVLNGLQLGVMLFLLAAGLTQQGHVEIQSPLQQPGHRPGEQVRPLIEFPAMIPEDEMTSATGPGGTDFPIALPTPVPGKMIGR